MTLFNTTCPVPKGSEAYGKHGSSWKPMLWIAAACSLLTLAISLSLCAAHLRRYRAPKEQRQILRIVFSVVVYSVVAFFELYSYEIAQYIDPIGDVYEAFGLCALLLLFIQYAAPTNNYHDDTLSDVREAAEKQFGYDWVQISWVFVFQYPLIEVLCVIVQEITQATGNYCLQSLDPTFAHLWLEIIDSVSISFCVLAIVRFYANMKGIMKMRRGLSKIVAFKIIVGIRFSQAWVFSTLLQHNVIKVGKMFSYNDVLYGIPAVLTCAEMVLFSLGFWYAYSSSEYSSKAHSREEPLPLLQAIVHALNPADLIGGIFRVPVFIVSCHRSGDWAAWRRSLRQQGFIGLAKKMIPSGSGGKKNSGGGSGSGNGNGSGDSAAATTTGGGVQSQDQRFAADARYTDTLARPPQPHLYADPSANSSVHSQQPPYEYPLAGYGGGAQDEEMYYHASSGDAPRFPGGDDEYAQQPPPFHESNSYLMADSRVSGGRARSPSGSFLMGDSPQQQQRLQAQQQQGQWNGRRYDRPPYRSPSPSPDPSRFSRTPVQERDMV